MRGRLFFYLMADAVSRGRENFMRPDGMKQVTYSLVAGGQNSEEYYRDVRRFADEVLDRASRSLARTVEGFLRRADNRYRWREDRVQCMRPRAEYHLTMVGAEIMNRAFRADFTSADTRAVLVPGCMRGRPEGECEAVKVQEGLLCQGCLSGCRVHQIRAMGLKHGFQVYVIPQASDLSLWSPRPGEPRRGVIASACVTTLVEGGWELKRYDVPAQCVLLDYSGCRKHWHREGVMTAMNLRELKRVLSG